MAFTGHWGKMVDTSVPVIFWGCQIKVYKCILWLAVKLENRAKIRLGGQWNFNAVKDISLPQCILAFSSSIILPSFSHHNKLAWLLPFTCIWSIHTLQPRIKFKSGSQNKKIRRPNSY